MADHFDDWVATVERTRASVAGAIGARADEIAFTTCTSTALSLAAGAVAWKPGDRVLYPADEFASEPLRVDEPGGARCARRGRARRAGRGVRRAARAHGPRRRAADRDLGGVVPRRARARRGGGRGARARGILVCVDAIQAVGAVPADVRAWGADFVACGAQKWLLGPVGAGFLWIARERLPRTARAARGLGEFAHAGDDDAPTLEFAEGAARFEPGLPDVAAHRRARRFGRHASRRRAAGRVRRGRRESRAARRGVRRARRARVHDGAPGATSGIVTVARPAARSTRCAPPAAGSGSTPRGGAAARASRRTRARTTTTSPRWSARSTKPSARRERSWCPRRRCWPRRRAAAPGRPARGAARW